MSKALQLSLFVNLMPKWEDVTMEWLLNYLQHQFPEMKFHYNKRFNHSYISQGISNKVELDFNIGKYDKCVTNRRSRYYIGCQTQKKFGDWHGRGETFDHMEEFIAMAEKRVEECKQDIKEFNRGKNDGKNKKLLQAD